MSIVRHLTVPVLALATACGVELEPDAELGEAASAIEVGTSDVAGTVRDAVVKVAAGNGCTGTLIAPDKVLTARHCLSDALETVANADGTWRRLLPGTGRVATGPSRAVDTYATPVDYYSASPAGTDGALGDDIMLLELRSMIPTDIAVPRAVALDRPATLTSTSRLFEIGYGGNRDRRIMDGTSYRDWTTVSSLKANSFVYTPDDRGPGIGDFGENIERGDSGGPILLGSDTGPVIGVLSDWDPKGIAPFGTGGGGRSSVRLWLDGKLREHLSAGAAVDHGWALVENPSAPTVRATMSRNSRGLTNTVARSSSGNYRVTFPGVARLIGGDVQIVAYGDDAAYCKLGGLDAVGDDLRINVRCFNSAGGTVDSKFFLSYLRERQVIAGSGAGPEPGMAYVSTAGTTIRDQWTSNGRGATIARPAIGRYQVTLPGQSSNTGSTVHVTALGADALRCKVASWFVTGGNTSIDVRCFTAAGAAADSDFHLAYHKARTAHAGNGGHAHASEPLATAYTPSASYRHHSAGAIITAGRSPGPDAFYVDFPNLGTRGTPVVTAYGADASHCKVHGWGSDVGSGVGIRLRVRCWNPAGAQVRSKFDVSWLAL